MVEGAVLVTGASGFIGSHIVANLLKRGRSVRACVRDLSDADRCDHLRALPIAGEGALELVRMDLFDVDSIRAAIDGCTDVIHAAAALYTGSKLDPQKDVVDPSITGCRNLVAAIEAAGCVKRLVHTSSTAAIRPTTYEDGTVFTTASWADDATLANNPYGLAKAGGERVVREWHASQPKGARPRLVTIHPCVVFGPPMSKRHMSGSLSYVEALIKRMPPKALPAHINIVDVRDVAEAHVRALTQGREEGRYLITSGDLWMRDLGDIARAAFPARKWPKGQLPYWACLIIAAFHPKVTVQWARTHLRHHCTYDSQPSQEDLGMVYRTPKESLIDSIPPILENGWA